MSGNLEEYHRKRHFDKTSEPSGDMPEEAATRRRFVVQHHSARSDHYDFRLELDQVLKSWAVPKGPSFSTRDKRLAIQVEDHPLDYQNFEGTIPKGEYGGGTVMIWDEGYWEPVGDPEEGLAKGDLKFHLFGTRLKGRWVLVHIKPRGNEKDVNWLLIKEKDQYVEDCDAKSFITSARTGRTMEEITLNMPSHTMDEAALPEALPAEQSRPAAKQDYIEGLTLCGVTITHPEKPVFSSSGLTKGDLAHYYLKVADRMMPYLADRLLSAVRCPEGTGESCFYRKHPLGQSEGVGVLAVENDKGKTEEYFYIRNTVGLLHEVQMNTLEFHLWGSKVESLERPDVMVFDLDPDEGMELAQIRQGVRDLKSILDDLSLTAFLKTTGGKGYHIVIPLKPKADWNVVKGFAQNIAKLMEAQWPKLYTSNSRKSARNGRIYLDWQRNIRGATSVSPYSVRNRKNATVSMPIRWDELDVVAPFSITIVEALERLCLKDPWQGYFEISQELKT